MNDPLTWRLLAAIAWTLLLGGFTWFARLMVSRIDRLEERLAGHAVEIAILKQKVGFP